MSVIDVHAHFLPAVYLTAMHAAGVHGVEGFALPFWSEHSHFEVMEKNGIASSILSISAPGLSFTTGNEACTLARRINEDAAERRSRTKGRFGAFAVLPLPDVDGALKELEYALDVLHLDGIGLLTNIKGIYLGDPAFDAIFAELDRREAVLYTHPVAPVGYKNFVMGFSASSLEYPFDTTRMILNLIATGTLRRFTKMKIIVSHGGGATPYLAWRMSNIAAIFNRQSPPVTPTEAEALMKTLYYDATAVANPVSLASYKSFVPADRRLFGSDTPFMPENSVGPALAELRGPDGLSEDDLAALEYTNAARLFPGLAQLIATR